MILCQRMLKIKNIFLSKLATSSKKGRKRAKEPENPGMFFF